MNSLVESNKKELIYLKIVSDIRNSIKSNALRPGDNILPERKLAEKFGVSYGTVRKAIQILTDEKLLSKVHGCGTFVTKSEPEPKKVKRIGINIPTLKLSYYADMVEKMERMITDNNYEFLLTNRDALVKSKNMLENILLRTKLDGLLLTGEIKPDLFCYIRDIAPDMHIIFLDGGVDGMEVNSIRFDDESGAFAATEHLIRQGRKEIIFIDAGRKYINTRCRENGYLAAMEKWSLQPWIKYVNGYGYENGVEAVQEVLAEGKIPNAIFCVTDLVAMGALQVLTVHKIKVPEEVALVGFSNLREADFARPRISSVKVDVKEISRLAVMEMIEKIEGRSKDLWQVVFPTHLIVRQSSFVTSINKSINNKKQGVLV